MIDTKALRRKVLELAIRGKLSRQLESDGTGESLYQYAQEEKKELIEQGLIKKEKVSSKIVCDEIPFEIPGNWRWTRLKDVFYIIMGQSPDGTTISLDNSGVEFHQGKTFFGDIYLRKSSVYTSVPTKIAEKESVLICVRAPVGVANISTRKICIGRGLCAVKPLGEIDIFFSLLSIRGLEKIILKQSKGTTFSSITGDVINNLLFPLPPLAEQKRIVKRVEEIFKLLDTIDEAQMKYSSDSEILKSKLIAMGIQGKLTEQLESDGTAEELYQQIHEEKKKLLKDGKIKKEKTLPSIADEEIPFEIPSSWKWCRLGNCIRLQSGQDFKPSEYNADNIGTPYLTGASNIDTSGELIINRWTEKPTCIAEKNDVLIVCKGSGYGKIAICTIDYAHIARQFMAVKYSNFIDTRYMELFLVSNFTVIKGNGQGLIPGIDRPSVLNLPFPLPPLAEQKRIADKLDELLKVIG